MRKLINDIVNITLMKLILNKIPNQLDSIGLPKETLLYTVENVAKNWKPLNDVLCAVVGLKFQWWKRESII